MSRKSTFSATDSPGRVRRLAYYGRWYLAAILGRRRPVIATIVLHEACNLSCIHCANSAAGLRSRSLSWDVLRERMIRYYREGSRIIFFEGGEPLLWRDGEHGFADLLQLARDTGYFSIGYTTNGTLPLLRGADVVSVSLDGSPAVHDAIRGAGTFALLKKHLEAFIPETGTTLFANAVISRENLADLELIGPAAAALPHISGVLYNIVTPPTGAGLLTQEEREALPARLRALSRGGVPILNSPAGLAALSRPDMTGRCPGWMSLFLLPDGREVYGCPLSENPESCQTCGFAAPREWRAMLGLRVFSALSLARRFAL